MPSREGVKTEKVGLAQKIRTNRAIRLLEDFELETFEHRIRARI